MEVKRSLMIINSDALKIPLRDGCAHCVITSPPYWGLRNYGVDGQFGLEHTPKEYIEKMVMVFREVKRVLRDDGTLWLNMADSYARNGGERGGGNRELLHMEGKQKRMKVIPVGSGLKEKDLCGIPWRLAFALQADGWYLRSDIIWAKPNPMPESVQDRPTKAHEYLFLLTKSPHYFFDQEAVKEKRTAEPKICGQNSQEFQDRDANHPSGWKVKVPGGWDTKAGMHRTIHREGRSGPEYCEMESNGRNIRTVWTIATQSFPDAHFATFPEKLVEPCIKAGTSEAGCCRKCGAPRVRMIHKNSRWPERKARGEMMRHGISNIAPCLTNLVSETRTFGWRPSCKCFGEEWSIPDYNPCLVVDPFSGAATVGVVAQRYRRAFVGLDLKMEYCKMGEFRIKNSDVPML